MGLFKREKAHENNRKKGSITVYLACMLGILLLVFTALYQNVVQETERAQALLAVDIGLNSAFACYDRAAYDRFGILFLNAEQDGAFSPGWIYECFQEYASPVLKESGKNMSISSGGFSGYRLITDESLKPMIHEIMTAAYQRMEEGTLENVSVFPWTMEELREFEKKGKDMEESGIFLSYFSENDIPSSEMQTEYVLDACLGTEETERNSSSGEMWMNGIGVSDHMVYTGMNDSVFRRYLISVLGNYCDRKSASAFVCEQEYLVFGGDSDRKCLFEMCSFLRHVREGMILSKSEVEKETSEAVFEGDESGEKEAEQKMRESGRLFGIYEQAWEDVLYLLKGQQIDDLDYEQCLSLLLREADQPELLYRLMGCIESEVRETESSGFRIDYGITAAEFSVEIAGMKKQYNISRNFGYD